MIKIKGVHNHQFIVTITGKHDAELWILSDKRDQTHGEVLEAIIRRGLKELLGDLEAER